MMTRRPQAGKELRGQWRRMPGMVAACAVVATGLVTAGAGMASANTATIAGILAEAGTNSSGGPLAVLSLGSVHCKAGTVVGNAAVVAGTVRLAAPCALKQWLYRSSHVTLAGRGKVVGLPKANDALMRHMKADALHAGNTFSRLTRTQTVPGNAIRGELTLRGSRGFNVVDVTGINLTGTLTLTGPRGTEWVINDSGTFTDPSGAIVLRGGLTASDVVFNVTSRSARVTMKRAAKVGNGILLAPHSRLSLSGRRWNGVVIGAGITLRSMTVVSAVTPEIPTATVGISASVSNHVWAGAPVHITAHLKGWNKPLGTVQFRYYRSRAHCRLATSAFNAGSRPSGGTYVSTGRVPAWLKVTSRGVTFGQGGTVYWAAYYSGLNSHNPAVAVNPAVSRCLPVHVGAARPGISPASR